MLYKGCSNSVSQKSGSTPLGLTRKAVKAQAMVEFTLVLLFLMTLVFGIMEFGYIFQNWLTVQNSAEEAARYATTGQGFVDPTVDQWDTARLAAIKAVANKRASGLKINSAAGPNAAGYFSVKVYASDPPVAGTEYPGGPYARVSVDVVYNLPTITPMSQIFGTWIQLKSHVELINERFRRIYGTPSGLLPPTIVPSITPTPTQIPTATPIPPVNMYFAVAAATVNENSGTYVVNVNLSTTSALNISAAISLSGSAVNGKNYTISPASISIPAGSLSQQVVITILDDRQYNANLTAVLTLASPVNASLISPTALTLTIQNTNPKPIVSFQVATSTISETASSIAVAIILKDSSGNLVTSGLATTVSFNLGGTAVLGGNYNLNFSPVVIPAGQSAGFIIVTPIDNGVFDPAKTLILSLSAATNGDGTTNTLGTPNPHTVTIQDDNRPQIYFSKVSQSVFKTDGTFTLQVLMDTTSSQSVSVPFTVGGSALSPAHYSVATSSPVTFAPGQTSVNITINLVNTTTPHGDVTVILTLGTPSLNAAIGSPAIFTLTIQDAYIPPTVAFNYSGANVTEGGTATLNVVLSKTANAAVTVGYSLSGSAASTTDYTYTPVGSVTIPIGQLSASIVFTTLTDNLYEGTESIVVTMGTVSGGGATKTTPNVSAISIIDADSMPTVYFNGTSNVVAEDSGTVFIPLKLSGKAASAVTATFAINNSVSSNPAVVGVDYTAITNYVVTFAAGSVDASIPVDVKVNPGVDMNPRDLVLELANPISGASMGSPARFTLTIRDNQICPTFVTITPDRNNKKLTLNLKNDRQYATNTNVSTVTVSNMGTNKTNTLGWLETSSTLTFNAANNVVMTISAAWTLNILTPPAPAAGYRLLFTFNSKPSANTTYTVTITYSNGCSRSTTATFP